MKSRFLFPHWGSWLGVLFFLVDIIYTILMKILNPEGFTQELDKAAPLAMHLDNGIHILLVVVGLLLIAFSKEKIEDEHLSQLRLDSLQWAMYVNYSIFIFCVIAFNGMSFLYIVAYNIITPLVFFILRFRWRIYMFNRELKSNRGSL